MIPIPDFTKHPICDSDIWISLCLGDAINYIFEKHEILLFADVVEKEILAFKSNKHYSFIAETFQKYKQSAAIFVINHTLHIDSQERMFMEKTLSELEFMHGLKNSPPERNKGEIVSAIYADHFSIPFLKSNDGTFNTGNMGRNSFPDLEVKNWYFICEEYINDSRKRIAIRKIVDERRKHLKRSTDEYKTGAAKLTTLHRLEEIMNAKRL